jgi:glutamate--cysteine ligase
MLLDLHQTPQLNTTLIEPLKFLEQHFLTNRETIQSWFKQQWQLTRPPVYGSVDLRNAGFKLAPVDMNLFPAGFNNLNPDFLSLTAEAAKKTLLDILPTAKRILVIPESHTRNLSYWENVYALQTILENAGFEVRFGMLGDEITTRQDIALPSGKKVTVEPLQRKNDALFLENFHPDLTLLNNDLSAGIPDILQNLKCPLRPPAELGWSQRLKSEHFYYYSEVVSEFAAHIKIDPWLIAPLFKKCGQIDFMQQEGMECLIANAELLFEDIKKKYTEYNIPYQPFLIIKADAGTYGMAVMTVRNIDEIKSMNRKQRTRMATIKGGQPVRQVIIQEGIYTFETFGPEQAVAEPVVYLWGDCVIGGFYRVHQDRGTDENLNTPGMRFEPLPFSQTCNEACEGSFYLYGIIAQLSMLAAAREIRDQEKT